MSLERLDKLLSNQSAWSRREVRSLVWKRRVTVDGVLATDPKEKLDPEVCQIEVDGRPILLRSHLYLMMNKPAGVVSASRDGKYPTVIDLVPEALKRKGLFPAGRLDRNTTGLVIITDDGELAHRILSPKKHVPKVYLARLDRPVTSEMAEGFSAGVTLADGTVCLPALLVPSGEKLGRVTLREGMYHQIKRMFAHYGATVLELRRLSMGGLLLDEALASGECRELTADEVRLLQQTDPDDPWS